MDVEIYTNTPNGSPLLAYGTASHFPSRGRWLGIGAAVIAGIALLSGGVYALTAKLPVPTEPALIAVLPAHTHIPDGLPALWRNATTESRWPVLVGLSWHERTLTPFVVTLDLGSAKDATAKTKGIFMLKSDAPLGSTQPWSASALMHTLFGRKQGSLSLRPKVFGLDMPDIEGALTSNGWETAVPASQPAQSLPAGDIAINLSAFPEAFDPMMTALVGNGYQLPADLPQPQAIAWQWHSSTSSGLRLDFSTALASTTQSELERTSLPMTRTYTLTDGGLANEITGESLPVSTSSENIPGPWVSNGLSWQTPTYIEGAGDGSSCAEGAPLFHVGGKALTRIQTIIGQDIPLTQIDAVEQGGHLTVCANFK